MIWSYMVAILKVKKRDNLSAERRGSFKKNGKGKINEVRNDNKGNNRSAGKDINLNILI